MATGSFYNRVRFGSQHSVQRTFAVSLNSLDIQHSLSDFKSQHMPRIQILFGAVVCLATGCIGSPIAAEETIEFNRDIRPILSEHCFECHGPDEGSRQADLRLDRESDVFGGSDETIVVRGNTTASELFQRITADDPELRMPPTEFDRALSAEQIEKIRQWIEAGADWQQHWAYVVPQRPAIPQVAGDELTLQNEIDHFVLERVAAAGLEPSPGADRTTLARRLSFDLLGLPPSIDEVITFVQDDRPVAYETYVDRLLESPHFGERMAMYWLDVVRYADSNGYHSDEPRQVAPYRDYVIEAFHENKPFDEFILEQLAGDLLSEAGVDQKVASGFNMLLQTTSEGGAQAKEYLAKYMADRVRNTSSIFLGVTLGCAECHDHKFDPFSTHDFYSMGAFFADIQEVGVGNPPVHRVLANAQDQRLKELERREAELRQQLDQATPELSAARQEWESGWQASASEPRPEASIVSEPWYVFSIAQPDGSRDLERAFEFVFPPEREMNLAKQYPEGSWKRSEDLADAQLHTLAGGPGTAYLFRRVHASRPMIAEIAAGSQDHMAVWFNGALVLEDRSTDEAKANEQQVTVHLQEGENTLLVKNATQKAANGFYFNLTPSKIPVTVLEILQVAAEERSDEQQQTLDKFFLGFAPELASARRELASLRREKYELFYAPTVKRTLMTVSANPRTIRVLPRGNWLDDSGQEVQPSVPGGLNALDVADRRANRLDLARWMVDRENPLTARVFVNRLWKLFFGRGLATPLDDLGAQGTAPTHPELLDWMAVEFIESGWDVKHMVKLMVISATYRQSSVATPSTRQQDPYNQLYARQARFRLDAEVVRDNALAVSGLLVREIGGRSVKPYQPAGYWRHLNFPTRTWQPDEGARLYRRGLYTWWQRMFLHPAMVAFDAPSREECTVERPRSNTPLQALVLLNDPTYVEAARVFAERILRDGGTTFDERLNWAMLRTLSRDAKPAELEALGIVYEQHKSGYGQDPEAANRLVSTGASPVPAGLDPAELAAWTSVTRILLNLHETISRI